LHVLNFLIFLSLVLLFFFIAIFFPFLAFSVYPEALFYF